MFETFSGLFRKKIEEKPEKASRQEAGHVKSFEKKQTIVENGFLTDFSAESVSKELQEQKWVNEDQLVTLRQGKVVGVFDGFDPERAKNEQGQVIYRNHGHKASQVAAESFRDSFEKARPSTSKEEAETAMDQAMLLANTRVGLEKQKPSWSGDEKIGSTFVGMEMWQDKKTGQPMLTVGNTGDSLAYLYRDGELKRISQEHSFVNFLNSQFGLEIDDQNEDILEITLADYIQEKGIEVKGKLIDVLKMPFRRDVETGNMINMGECTISNLRNITVGGFNGGDFSNEKIKKRVMSINTVVLEEGDKILLCTDGLTDATSDAKIAKIIQNYEEKGPEAIKSALIEFGKEAQIDKNNRRANKPDDITVAWVEYKDLEESEVKLTG